MQEFEQLKTAVEIIEAVAKRASEDAGGARVDQAIGTLMKAMSEAEDQEAFFAALLALTAGFIKGAIGALEAMGPLLEKMAKRP